MAQSLAAALDVAPAVLLQSAATIKGALFLSHLALQLTKVLNTACAKRSLSCSSVWADI